MSLNVGDQECNSGKKYGQKGTLCGPNRNGVQLLPIILTLPQGHHPHLVHICVGFFGWCCLNFSRPWKE
jgi:hypothetical protein